MSEQTKTENNSLRESSVALDAAYGQEVITLNEFRLLLGLDCVDGGDITIKGRNLGEAIRSKSSEKK